MRSGSRKMGETFRAFIAVGVPPEIAGALWEEGRAAKGAGGVRWTRPESIHLTLKFLGGIPAEKGGAVIDALGRAVEGIAPFDLEVRGLGAFPNDRAPRVVWAGLIGKLDALMGLRDAVEREVAPLWFPTEERGFSPHLTFGRIKEPRRNEAFSHWLAERREKVFGRFRVGGVLLMESRLSPGGSVYTVVGEAALGAGS